MADTSFETARPPNPIFCHEEFLDKLQTHDRDGIGRRASFLLQRLCFDARRVHYKATQGENRGWRRSRLGGNSGSHFYAWWAPKNALPLKANFGEVPDGGIFLRDIRHHDDHRPLPAHSFETHYMPVTVADLRRGEYAPTPWTQPQARYAAARQAVRLLKGHPGSGKTTALLHAADASGASQVLYITYSRNLAALARDYFDRLCSAERRFHVLTYSDLLRLVLSVDTPVPLESDSRQRFLRDLWPFTRTLGAWATNQGALYDELYAHLVGDALPVAAGRFVASKQPRVPDKAYRQTRTRFIGEGAALSTLDAAARIEKLHSSSLAERYFPELALAWHAAERLQRTVRSDAPGIDAGLLEFECIALDECQDLTPVEAFVIVQLTRAINHRRRMPVPLLIAGDEAQTVRPTDFEWSWLSDLLHSEIGTPSEYKLSANLRSPQRIATIVNRVWDLYAHVQKQDRPSGTGYAEIEDDATDQILYCSAAPGPELNRLLTTLSAREGLALISFEDEAPAYVPAEARAALLTLSEAKGLDFHSVCVLDAGRNLERIVRDDARLRADCDINGLRRRLAIDQLRVALSRPTERLIWLDVNPTDEIIRTSIGFLNRGQAVGVAACVPEALLTTLEEDELDPEERVQRCRADALQYLDVRPEIAFSRAQQAVTLLGPVTALAAVADEAARTEAYLTLSQVCFLLGVRNARLTAELGRPDLFQESSRAAMQAGRFGLAAIIDVIGRAQRAGFEDRLNELLELARIVPARKSEIEPWLHLELSAKAKAWLVDLEAALVNGRNAQVLLNALPPFYEALELPDRAERVEKLRQRAIHLLIRDKQFTAALAGLRTLPERQPKLEAVCHEGLRDFRSAAECHLLAGNRKEALACYRSIPDFNATLKLIDEMGEHPAAESLRWIAEMQKLVDKRPEKFTRMIVPEEKKLLEDILERSLGVSRRKVAARKSGTKRTVTKKTVTKKTVASPSKKRVQTSSV